MLLGSVAVKVKFTSAACCQVLLARSRVMVGGVMSLVNVLVSDVGVPLDSILMDSDTGALGYGIEYAYSIIERLKLAALMGDSMCQMPIISHPGGEAWRQKEARAAEGVPDAWGNLEERAVIWEEITATALIDAGSDLVVMCHPKAVEVVKATIGKLSA